MRSFGLWKRPSFTTHRLKELKSFFLSTSNKQKFGEILQDGIRPEYLSLLFLIYFNLFSQRQPLRQKFLCQLTEDCLQPLEMHNNWFQ